MLCFIRWPVTTRLLHPSRTHYMPVNTAEVTVHIQLRLAMSWYGGFDKKPAVSYINSSKGMIRNSLGLTFFRKHCDFTHLAGCKRDIYRPRGAHFRTGMYWESLKILKTQFLVQCSLTACDIVKLRQTQWNGLNWSRMLSLSLTGVRWMCVSNDWGVESIWVRSQMQALRWIKQNSSEE